MYYRYGAVVCRTDNYKCAVVNIKRKLTLLDFKVKIGLVPDVRDLGNFKTRKGINCSNT